MQKEISEEIKFGLHRFKTYLSFSKRVKKSKLELINVLKDEVGII